MSKVLLAFSGGLDTSYCARYLSVDLGMDVHSVIVDTGGFTQTELAHIAGRAKACGVTSHATLDRTQELFDRVLRFCIAGNVLKNGTYPLSVSAERVVQAIAIAEHAIAIGATHIAHGSTGAGNDQIRFDVIFRILCPDLPIFTPIRDQKLSREDEIAYLKSAYSINQGIWGTTIGGRETLTSDQPLPEYAWPSTGVAPAEGSEHISITFDKGLPVALNGEFMPALSILRKLNQIGSAWRIGRDMHIGDTILGIKGRVAFEAPAALMTIKAHHALEKHTLTKWQLMLKDQLALWYGQLLHEGQFLEPAMRDIEDFFTSTQCAVSGTTTIKCSHETFSVLGVESDNDLMRSSFATYGEENNAWDGADARGFAAISSIATSLWRSVNGGQS
jgi:argininosuccinate synthase